MGRAGSNHGERAFEAYLRARQRPFLSINEARRCIGIDPSQPSMGLKNFDYVLYAGPGVGPNLLVDVKCRRLPLLEPAAANRPGTGCLTRHRRALPNWATREDLASLASWQQLFGPGFVGAFVFLYWCDDTDPGTSRQPPDGLFDAVFLHDQRWYALRTVLADEYAKAMKTRSPRWQTVDVPAAAFERLTGGVCAR